MADPHKYLHNFSSIPHVQSQKLNLKFKGDRTYIHGSDIFNDVDRVAGKNNDGCYLSHLAFRRFARRDCELLWVKPSPGKPLVAQGSVRHSDTDRPFWVVELHEPAAGRYEFDEAGLVAPAIRDREEIVLENRSIYTPIEEIIALTKRLNCELTPDVDGKWLFGQLNLSCALPSDYSSLRIRRVREVAGRFSLNDIIIDSNNVGNIRFIVGAP